jgi:hypothetical protein
MLERLTRKVPYATLSDKENRIIRVTLGDAEPLSIHHIGNQRACCEVRTAINARQIDKHTDWFVIHRIAHPKLASSSFDILRTRSRCSLSNVAQEDVTASE